MGGYLLFVLVLLATRVLLARGEISDFLVAEIPKNPVVWRDYAGGGICDTASLVWRSEFPVLFACCLA